MYAVWVGLGAAMLLNGCTSAEKATRADKHSESMASPAPPISDQDQAARSQTTAPQGVQEHEVTLEGLNLVLAARYGHENVVRIQLDGGADVDMRDELGYTPLIAAAEEGHGTIVALLLKQGASVNARTHDGLTALMAAADKGALQTVQILLEAGAGVDIRGRGGETALMDAVKYGHHDIVELLLANGADPDIRNQSGYKDHGGYTPLMYAAQHGMAGARGNWLAIVSALLAKGASPNLARVDGTTALSIAQRHGYSNIVEALRNAGARDETPYAGLNRNEALVRAAKLDDIAKARELLKGGADPNYRDKNTGVTPLLTAAYYGHGEIIAILVKQGADVNHKPWGMREQRIASSNASLEERELMRSAARGDTALISVVRRGYPAAADFLLDNGADYTILNSRGESATLLAARLGRPEIMRLLLANGADPDNAPADRSNDTFITNLAPKKRPRPLLIEAVLHNHTNTMDVLIDGGAEVDLRDRAGKTALFWAAQQGYVNPAKRLLDRGAKPDLRDHSGRTPLMMAAKNGYKKIVEILLKHDTQVNAIESGDQREAPEVSADAGMTALIYAALGGHADIVRMLLAKGADTSLRDTNGDDALAVARSNGHTEIIQLLTSAKKQN